MTNLQQTEKPSRAPIGVKDIVALCAQLPDVADNKWTTPEGAKMAREYAQRTRLDLAMMHLSDYELANAQYLCPRESLELEQYQTAAKERIRWLSVQLALQQLKSNALAALCAQMAAALEEIKKRDTEIVEGGAIRDAAGGIIDAFDTEEVSGPCAKIATRALTAYRTLSPDPVYAEARNMFDILSRIKSVDGVHVTAAEIWSVLGRINRARGEG